MMMTKSEFRIIVDKRPLDAFLLHLTVGNLWDKPLQAVSERVQETVKSSWTGIYQGAERSRPGDPPYIDTGDLNSTIKVKRVKRNHWQVLAGGGDTPAFDVEFGHPGRSGNWVAERPFMRPAALKTGAELNKVFGNSVEQHIASLIGSVGVARF